MLPSQSATDSFSEFFRLSESKLRQALIPVLGVEVARDAAAEALAYGWENWDRVRVMDNPVGYLYRVGRSKGRRMSKRRVVFAEVPRSQIPEVEPGLPSALARLSQRQRTAVMLVYCYEWTYAEVSDLLGVSRSSVQSHVERGMASLRRSIGGVE